MIFWIWVGGFPYLLNSLDDLFRFVKALEGILHIDELSLVAISSVAHQGCVDVDDGRFAPHQTHC